MFVPSDDESWLWSPVSWVMQISLMKQVNRYEVHKILLILVLQTQWCHKMLTAKLNEKLMRKKLVLGLAVSKSALPAQWKHMATINLD